MLAYFVGASLLGLVLPLGFGPPELRPLHAAQRAVNSCASPRPSAVSTWPRRLEGTRSETGFFHSLPGCSGGWGGFGTVGACNHSLQATQSRRVDSLPFCWRLVALLDVGTGFGPPELGRYTPPSWCLLGSIRRRGAFSTWGRLNEGACSARPFFKLVPGRLVVGFAFVWGWSSCNQALQATAGPRVLRFVRSLAFLCFERVLRWPAAPERQPLHVRDVNSGRQAATVCRFDGAVPSRRRSV